jgi:hypothetical protein
MTITFGTLNPQTGELTDVKQLDNRTIDVCPNVIFDSDHYHDGYCDCFVEEATHMKEWGYTWNNSTKQWGA